MSRATVYLYSLGGSSYAPALPWPPPKPRTWAECYALASRCWNGDGQDGLTPCAEDVTFAAYLGQPWDGRDEPDAIIRRGPRGGVRREGLPHVPARWGWLHRYSDGQRMRKATRAERDASRAAAQSDGGRGVFAVLGVACYVAE